MDDGNYCGATLSVYIVPDGLLRLSAYPLSVCWDFCGWLGL